jgi:hypothetical protein
VAAAGGKRQGGTCQQGKLECLHVGSLLIARYQGVLSRLVPNGSG